MKWKKKSERRISASYVALSGAEVFVSASHWSSLRPSRVFEKFIPTLLDISPSDVTGELSHLLSLSVKHAGLSFRNPMAQAADNFEASRSAVHYLVESLVNR